MLIVGTLFFVFGHFASIYCNLNWIPHSLLCLWPLLAALAQKLKLEAASNRLSKFVVISQVAWKKKW